MTTKDESARPEAPKPADDPTAVKVDPNTITLPPLSQDPDYPPMLRELAEVMERELRSIGVEPATAVAESVTEAVRERFGGQQNYWAKGNTMRQRLRRAQMWADFDGRNYLDISRKYGICFQQAYRAIATARAEHLSKVQPSLFDGPGEPA